MGSIPKRQTCGVCGKTPCQLFHVPDEIWLEAVHPSRQQDIHCLDCFTARADEKLLLWDKDIQFYPVSMRTHIQLIPGVTLDDALAARENGGSDGK